MFFGTGLSKSLRGYAECPAEAAVVEDQTVPLSWPQPATFLISRLFFPPFLVH